MLRKLLDLARRVLDGGQRFEKAAALRAAHGVPGENDGDYGAPRGGGG